MNVVLGRRASSTDENSKKVSNFDLTDFRQSSDFMIQKGNISYATQPALMQKQVQGNKFDTKSTGERSVYEGSSAVSEFRSKPNVYVCSVCSKVCASPCSLAVHMRVHNGIKPFICKWCNKAFSQHGTLYKHTRIHTGEKPFICQMCRKAFAYKHVLERHLKKHPQIKTV